jgi:hypothetical protein
MATEVSICSNALRKLGDDPITSLTDDTERARLCNAFYAPTRDALLRSHPWNFAIARAELSKLSTTPAFDYTAEFTLPTDPYCLRVLQMDYQDINFKVEGRKLLCNEDSAKILYIAKVTDTAQFDSMFTELLTSRMSAELAYSVTGSNTLSKQMWELYDAKVSESRSIDGAEGFIDGIVSDTFTSFRG